MKVIAPITEVYGTPRVSQKRRVEKPNGASGLGQQTRAAHRSLMLNRVACEETLSSHFETTSRICDFDHAIPAPFIAQVIGQVLKNKACDFASAMRAYAGASASSARLVRAI